MTDMTFLKSVLRFSMLALAIHQSAAFAGQPDFTNIAFLPVPLPEGSTQPPPALVSFETSNSIYSATHSRTLEDAKNLETSIAQYRQSILDLEANYGPYSALIPQQAETLGELFMELGNPASASEAFEKSLHVMRTNQGLYSAGQQALLRKLIQAELAMNDLQRAQELHESLFHLQQKLFDKGDSNYIAAQLEWADWNVDRLLLAESIPGNHGVNQQRDITRHLLDAQDSYLDVIEQLHAASDNKADTRLIHAEKKLAAISYIASSKARPARTNPLYTQADENGFTALDRQDDRDQMAYFFNGSNALKRAIAYSMESPRPDYLSIAEQMMDLGDWYLLFDRRAAALEIYADAFDVLVAIDASEEDIARVMSPGMPVTAPDSPGSTRVMADTGFTGYIDIAFQVSKFGSARSAEVIGASDTDATPVTQALLRKIRQEKFRPAFINGTAASNENIKLRYYYSYN